MELSLPPHRCTAGLLVKVAEDVVGIRDGLDCIVVLAVEYLPELVFLIVVVRDQRLDPIQLLQLLLHQAVVVRISALFHAVDGDVDHQLVSELLPVAVGEPLIVVDPGVRDDP